MSKVLTMMKTNHSSFELIPEEEDSETMENHGDAANAAAAAAAAAQQAAITARILQQNFSGQLTLPDLALHQHFFNQQLLQEQFARNREFLLLQQQTENAAAAAAVASAAAAAASASVAAAGEREKHLGLIFQQVNNNVLFLCQFCSKSGNR